MTKIGLEIHGYINTKEKLFCNCKVEEDKKGIIPNSNICPICTGQPGSKPLMTNKEAIKKATQIALILGCKINEKLTWQRKHYSWPDNPKGYQTTLSGPHAKPNGEHGKFLGIKITECHLEEDPAAWNPENGEIDYNRSGYPLIEIVTEPDFKDSEQVIDWLKNLLSNLNYIKAITRKSGIKADVNISIDGGERVELKNINSLKKIKDAIEVEIKRQEKELPKIQETRMYDEKHKKTKLMRTKENAMDYRFISDPDLPQIVLTKEEIKKIKDKLPELPLEKLKKIIEEHKIDKKSARILTKNVDLTILFEEIVKKIPAEIVTPWVTVELLGMLNYNKIELEDIEINPEHFIHLLQSIKNKKITELQGKDILRSWKNNSFNPQEKIEQNKKIDNIDEIESLAKQVIKENKKAVEDYKKGEEKSINFLIGQVMKVSNKRADFKHAKEILEKLLK